MRRSFVGNITLMSRRIVFNFVGNILALELWIFVTAFYAFLHTQCVLTIVYFSNPPYLFDFHWETVWDIYLFFKTLKDFFFFYGHELLNFPNHVLCPCWFHVYSKNTTENAFYIHIKLYKIMNLYPWEFNFVFLSPSKCMRHHLLIK